MDVRNPQPTTGVRTFIARTPSRDPRHSALGIAEWRTFIRRSVAALHPAPCIVAALASFSFSALVFMALIFARTQLWTTVDRSGQP